MTDMMCIHVLGVRKYGCWDMDVLQVVEQFVALVMLVFVVHRRSGLVQSMY